MFEHVLVPLDGSGFGEEVLPFAAAIARQTDVDVGVVHVHVPHTPVHLLSNTQYQFEGVTMEEYDLQDCEEEEAYLARVADRIREAGGAEVQTWLLRGRPLEALEDYARSRGPGLVLMTTHGRTGLSRAWLGSVADALVRHSPWPILLVRPQTDDEAEISRFSQVLIPLDGSERSERIVPPTLDLAVAMGSRVTLLNVIAPVTVLGTRVLPVSVGALSTHRHEATDYLETVAGRFRAAGVPAEIEVVDDPRTDRAILDVAERIGADLVALATHGYRGVRRAVLGSVADKVLRASDVPLLLLGPSAHV